MTRKLFYTFLALALLAYAPMAPASLEVSLTITGDISEIQALLRYIEQRNQRDGADNPLKLNLHSVTNGPMTRPNRAPEAIAPVAVALPQLSTEKLTPGKPAVVTVAVRDESGLVDTVALELVGTDIRTDLYDDGSRGDVTANDGVWSATLTPVETTPAGRRELLITVYDRNGQALHAADPEGNEQPLQARREVSIER